MNVKEIPILSVANSLGIAVNEHNKAICLWHNDKNPSLSFETKENFCKCFSCGGGSSTIDLVMQARGFSDIQAIEWLKKEFGNGDNAKYVKPIQIIKEIEPVNLAIDPLKSEIYNFLISQGSSYDDMPEIVQKYFTDVRKISSEIVKEWNIRYYSEQKRKEINDILTLKFDKRDLLKSGVINKYGYSFYNSYLLFPFFNSENKIFYIQGKTIRSVKSKYWNLTNNKENPVNFPYGYHNLNDSNIGSTIYLTEGLFDTLSLNKIGLKAIGILGVNQLKEHYRDMLKPYNIVFIGDNDKAGLILREAVKRVIPTAKIKVLPNEYKDINDYCRRVKK